MRIKDKQVILILGSQHYFEELAKTCIENGYYTIVCDNYTNGPAKKIAHKSYNVDVFDIKQMEKICIENEVSGIVTGFSDVLMEAYVPLCEKMGLKCYLSDEQLKIIRNKQIMHQILGEFGVKTMQRKVIYLQDIEQQLIGFKFPAVIKPIDGYGSRGVFKVNSIREIKEKYTEVENISKKRSVIIEEYNLGKEYNFFAWVKDGKGYLIYICNREKFTFSPNDIGLVYKFIYPSSVYEKLFSSVIEYMEKIIQAYKIQDGPLAVQMFYDGNEVVINEATLRLFGNGDHRIAFYLSGLKIEQILIEYSMGRGYSKSLISKLENYNPRDTTIIAQIQLYGKEGYIKEIDGVSTIKEMPNVSNIELYYQQGECIRNKGLKRETIGMVFFKVDRYDDIEKKLDEIYNVLHIIGDNGEELLYRI